jgi:hypothetical protein
VRSLSDSEVRVIRELLADLPTSEQDHVSRSGVPRTTYQSVRARVFNNGWLIERYVPSPELAGSDCVEFTLAQPFAEQRGDAIAEILSDKRVVLLWSSPDTLLSVGLRRGRPGAPDPDSSNQSFRQVWTVSSGPGELLAYFDFEGAWSRWTLGPESVGYPRSIGNTSWASQGTVAGLTPLERRNAWDLVKSTWTKESLLPGLARLVQPGLRRRRARLISEKIVDHRIFADLQRMPPVEGRRVERVVFVTGTRLPDTRPLELFEQLVGPGAVSPFLYAFDQQRILMATLSPRPEGGPQREASVLGLLRGYLRQIEVIREPIGALRPLIDHRYDRVTS